MVAVGRRHSVKILDTGPFVKSLYTTRVRSALLISSRPNNSTSHHQNVAEPSQARFCLYCGVAIRNDAKAVADAKTSRGISGPDIAIGKNLGGFYTVGGIGKYLKPAILIPLHKRSAKACAPRFAQRRPTTPSNIVVHPCPPMRRIHPPIDCDLLEVKGAS